MYTVLQTWRSLGA